MGYYKITNITDTLPKRHEYKDAALDIIYHVGFQKKTKKLNVGQEIVYSVTKNLPIEILKLRGMGLITVIPISENQFTKLQKPSAKKPNAPVVVEKPKETAKKKTVLKKKKVDEPKIELDSNIEE